MKRKVLAFLLCTSLMIQPVLTVNAETLQSESETVNMTLEEETVETVQLESQETVETIQPESEETTTTSKEETVEAVQSECEETAETVKAENDEVLISLEEDNAVTVLSDTYGVVIESGDCGATTEDNLIWTAYDSDTDGQADTLVISGNGAMKDYLLTNQPWYKYKEMLKYLVLEKGITYIGEHAFYQYDNFMGKLVIPDGVSGIGMRAFYGCSGFSGNLVLPNELVSINEAVFMFCSGFSGDLIIPNKVTSIGALAFSNCSGLNGNLVLSDSVINIGDYSFFSCSGFTGGLTLPDKLESIGEKAFSYCDGFSGNLVIPDSVLSIGKSSFDMCWGFKGGMLILSQRLSKIEARTFYGCKFSGELLLPEGLMQVDADAFNNCRFNGDLVLGEKIVHVGQNAFFGSDDINKMIILNAECSIYDSEYTFPKTVVCGYKDSTAQSYAEKYGREFEIYCAHNWDAGTITTEPTCVETGIKTFTCSLCGETKTETIVALGHEYSDQWTTDEEPTCGEAGSKSHHCIRCSDKSDVTEIPATEEHVYSEPQFTWNDDNTCIAVYSCINCSKAENQECGVISETTNPTCTEAGRTIYTAKNTFEGKDYADTKEVEIPAKGHSYGEAKFTWSEDNACEVEFSCSSCSNVQRQECTVTSETKGAVCTKGGLVTYTAICNFKDTEYKDSKVVEIPAKGHEYEKPVFNWKEDYSLCTAEFTCVHGDDIQTVECQMELRTTNPTCTEAGKTVYTAKNTFEGKEYTDIKEVEIPVREHSYGEAKFIWAEDNTCEVEFVCSVCSNVQRTECTVTGETKDDVCVIIYTATYNLGEKEYTDTKEVEISANGHNYGEAKFIWTEDNTCTAEFACSACGNIHKLECEVTSDADSAENSKVTYIATCNFEGKEYVGSKIRYGAIIESGSCGATSEDDLTWTVYDSDFDGQADTLVISGTGAMKDYDQNAKPWNNYKNLPLTLVLENGITHIGAWAFCGYDSWSGSLIIPDSVTSIGEFAFAVCAGFTGNLILPDKLTHIGEKAFMDCIGFTGELVIPEGITNIEAGVFEYCPGFNGNLVIPEGVKGIGSGAFWNCSDIDKIIIENAECDIYFSDDTLPPVIVCGYRDSTAQKYAQRYGRIFEIYCIHSWDTGTITTEPTCINAGMKTFTCNLCQGTKTETVAALGHEYSEKWTTDKEATCSEAGSKSHHCIRCGEKADVTEIPATGNHLYGIPHFMWNDDYTCKAVYSCENCSQTENYNCKVTSETINPTCTEKGKTIYTASCNLEGEEYTDNIETVIAEKGHKYSQGWIIDKEATCTENGSKSHHCTICGDKIDATTIPMAEHKYDAGVVIKEPTTTENGVKTYTCKVCEGTKTESIPRLLRIIYNANGGSGAPDTQVKIQNQLLVLSSKKPTKTYKITYNANVENIANVSKNITCTFKNWNTQANGSGTNYNSGESYTGNQDLTLYAQWENPEIGTLPIPNRPDYIFDGWYTELNGENRVTSPTVITGDMILYAHWTADVPQDPIEAFVARLYKEILGRKADPSGLKAWSDVLKSGKEQGAKVAQGFVDSEELKKRNLSDDAYIHALYRTFFNREADGGGLEAWKSVLDSGLSRMHVFKGFAESNEFTKVCDSYGIIRGYADLTAPMDQNEGVTKFVARCYKLCLGRTADESGLNGWCNQILTGTNTAKEAACGFVFSNEFLKKNLSDTEYIKVLYRVFMDREADGSGLVAWEKVLRDGQGREHVFNGFADSPEFREICARYGIE